MFIIKIMNHKMSNFIFAYSFTNLGTQPIQYNILTIDPASYEYFCGTHVEKN